MNPHFHAPDMQTYPSKSRKFSPRMMLLSVALIVASVGAGLLLAWALDDGGRVRVSIQGLILIVIGPLAGLVGIVVSFFGTGCSACKRELVTREYDYPATMYPYLAEQLASGGASLNFFLRAPIEMGPHAAVLTLEVCERCERLGSVTLAEKVPGRDGEKDELRSTDERWLEPAELAWIPALRANRAASRGTSGKPWWRW